MATNADEPVVDDDKQVTEEDLRNLKYGTDEVETSEEADEATETEETEEESEEAGDDAKSEDTTEESEEEQSEAEPSFVKEFPNIKGDTPEEYAKNLEIAYKNSTGEALNLKGKLAKATTQIDKGVEEPDIDVSDPLTMWASQELEGKVIKAYADFSASFPQVLEPDNYTRFTQTVDILAATIKQSERRFALPEELYSKTAVILGWQPGNAVTDKEKLGSALKDTAATTKTTSGTKKAQKSKVTDAMVSINRRMYPNKTDAEIREELEPYVT